MSDLFSGQASTAFNIRYKMCNAHNVCSWQNRRRGQSLATHNVCLQADAFIDLTDIMFIVHIPVPNEGADPLKRKSTRR